MERGWKNNTLQEISFEYLFRKSRTALCFLILPWDNIIMGVWMSIRWEWGWECIKMRIYEKITNVFVGNTSFRSTRDRHNAWILVCTIPSTSTERICVSRAKYTKVTSTDKEGWNGWSHLFFWSRVYMSLVETATGHHRMKERARGCCLSRQSWILDQSHPLLGSLSSPNVIVKGFLEASGKKEHSPLKEKEAENIQSKRWETWTFPFYGSEHLTWKEISEKKGETDMRRYMRKRQNSQWTWNPAKGLWFPFLSVSSYFLSAKKETTSCGWIIVLLSRKSVQYRGVHARNIRRLFTLWKQRDKGGHAVLDMCQSRMQSRLHEKSLLRHQEWRIQYYWRLLKNSEE